MTAHEHDHDRTAAPMVDEITDFEVLEIALRELCIEKGIFTAQEHRRNIYEILTCLDVLLFDFGHLSRQKPMPVLVVAQL